MARLAVVLLFAFSGLFSGCSEDTDTYSGDPVQPADNSRETWSVFLYLCGTDLESDGGFATDNLNELLSVHYTGGVDIYVQTGGTAQWSNDFVDPGKTQRFHVQDGETQLVDEQALSSMGDPDTLQDFLSWGVNNYPADKMGVIFWNHGGGTLSGAEFDELFDNDSLTLDELQAAFGGAQEETGGMFEFIGFDTCLMATVETANLLAPYANYLVASEETEPGGGWDYTSWAQYLSDSPGASGADLGRVICDSFYEKCASLDEEAMATLSVVDFSKLAPLVSAFDDISQDLAANVDKPEYFAGISRGAARSESYGGDTPGEGYTNQVDLGHLVSNIADVLPDGSATTLLSALDDAVVYQVNGENRQNATGLSLFFPMTVAGDEENLEKYDAITASRAYTSFVDQSLSNGQDAAQQEDFVSSATEPYIDDDGIYSMDISPESMVNVQDVTFSLYLREGGQYLYLGSDNDLYVDWDTGHVEDNFRGVWPTLDGYYVSFNMVDSTDEYIVYSIPILLNGTQTNLRATWTWDEPDSEENAGGRFTVLGTWTGVDMQTGMAEREIIPVKDGDSIIPLFYVYDDKGTEEIVEGDEIIASGSLLLEEQELFAGEYWYAFNIIDVYGNETTTDYAVITVDDVGEMTIE